MPGPGFLNNESVDISDHLRNHVHLTNCIHMKNHLHRLSPAMTEKSLLKDLAALRRSRSLRDPSMSPHSWHSPSDRDAYANKVVEDLLQRGRRSLDAELNRDGGRLLMNSFSPDLTVSKNYAVEGTKHLDGRVSTSHNRVSGANMIPKRPKQNESHTRHKKVSPMGPKMTQNGEGFSAASDLVSAKTTCHEKKIIQKESHHQNGTLLSKHLQESISDNEQGDWSQLHLHARNTQNDKLRHVENGSSLEQGGIGSHCNGMTNIKKCTFEGTSKSQLPVCSGDAGRVVELSVASNSFPQASGKSNHLRQEEENAALDVTYTPGSGCGIPWNWSRIHHRSKAFLDKAGKSFSSALSDTKSTRAEDGRHKKQVDTMDVHEGSDHFSSSGRYDVEALPLLLESSGVHGSGKNSTPEYYHSSGELSIFVNSNPQHFSDSDFLSEGKSQGKHKPPKRHQERHQSLTQKYMPRSFRNLVGQNLVVKALSNAAMKNKIGFLYVFYGPHGTGKSSCARIFSRSLNCQSMDLPRPCGVCTSCVAFDLDKNRNVQEVGCVSGFDIQDVMDNLKDMITSNSFSNYKVFILDDCGNMSPAAWSAISKVMDLAPRKVVFILICTNLEHLPHTVISRCQKIFFPKLKDADVIHTLQLIAAKEGIDIDKDALKLIASRSDGSLLDAEMMLDQLSLLGQKVSLQLVQELVGLVSDDMLVDLLDLALSGDTVNTVKTLREIMGTGVEPLALMSQLATAITDILAGSYVFTKERQYKKFFQKATLSKEQMEKLRQALKTLSEAEKQLRMSNDRLTWLTAALLHLAPEKRNIVPNSEGTSLSQYPINLAIKNERELHMKSPIEQTEGPKSQKSLALVRYDNNNAEGASLYRSKNTNNHEHVIVDTPQGTFGKAQCINRRSHDTPQGTFGIAQSINRRSPNTDSKGIKEIWAAVLENIQIHSFKRFLQQEGKLTSVTLGTAPSLQLTFSSCMSKTTAEKFIGRISNAFESVLGRPIRIEISCEPIKDRTADDHTPPLPLEQDLFAASGVVKCATENHAVRTSQDGLLNSSQSEIVEVEPQEHKYSGFSTDASLSKKKGGQSYWVEEICSHQCLDPVEERETHSGSAIRSQISLAHAIKQARIESHLQRSGFSKHKAMSIAEKLEEENLRLEPGSRGLRYWGTCRFRGRKLPRLKLRTRRPRSLVRLVSCSGCLTSRMPK